MPSKRPTKKKSPFISDRPIGEQLAHFGVLVENLTSQVQQVAEGQVQLGENLNAKIDSLGNELRGEIKLTQQALSHRIDAVDNRVEGIEKKLVEHDKRFEVIDKRFDTVDKRFEAIDKRFDAVDKRFEAIDRRFDQVDKRFDRLEEKVDVIGKKVEEHDVEIVQLKEAV